MMGVTDGMALCTSASCIVMFVYETLWWPF